MSKEYKWSPKNISDQSGKVVIVTGANSGIGYEAARTLALHGATVILACRNLEKARAAAAQISSQAPQGQALILHLDLSDLASIQKFTEDFQAQFNRLDILINNAGVMAPPFQKTMDGFELQFGVNHLGHFKLTALLIDLLKSTPQARVVTVSSNVHFYGKINFDNLNAERFYQAWLAYAQSKLANLLFGYELQRRLSAVGNNPLSSMVHPGYAATNLQRNSRWASLLNPILAQSAAMGALPTLYAAISPEIKGGEYIGPDGFFGQGGYPRQARSSRASHDLASARRLWEISEQLTQTPFPLD
jgi:NAD(P)-dependent dehydrogenase (short-subunit alcohol dehydrogenase family)